MDIENQLSKGKSRWASKTKEEKSAHAKLMSDAYWKGLSEDAKKAHAARARAGKMAKKAEKQW